MTMPQFSVPGVAHLHGEGYTEAQFNAEVQQRSQAHYEEDMPREDVDNIFWNVARDVFCEWNGLEMEDRAAMEFSRELRNKMNGHQSVQEMQAGGSGAMDPVHGITLEDWAGANAKIVSGTPLEDLLRVLNVEKPQWDEATATWMARMSADTTFSISTAYAAAFTDSNIGRFANSGLAVAPDSPMKIAAMENLELYVEIFCAQSAAYQFGLDGAQYVKDTWGLSLMDTSTLGMHWSARMQDDIDVMRAYGDLTSAFDAKYKEHFAAAQGGNVGDDIEF